MSFNKLLQELDHLRKSQAADPEMDATIAAAAAADEDDEEATDADADAAEEGDDELLGKSFKVVLPSGEEAQGFDGMALIKSMNAQLVSMTADRDADHGVLSKALTGMMEVIEEQGKTIKLLNDQITKISSEGAGRRSVTVADPLLAKAQQNAAALGTGDILAKCEAAFDAGKISGLDLSTAESSVNRNMPVPDRILAKMGQ